MASSLGDKDHSRFAALVDSLAQDWHSIDAYLHFYLSPLLSSLLSGHVWVMEAGEEFSSILSSAISSNVRAFIPTQGSHRPHSIDKLVSVTTKKKNESRKYFKANPPLFLDAVRAHNKVFQAAQKSSEHRSAIKQERAFCQNPWKYSKSVCCSKSQQRPSFSETICFEFFKAQFYINNGPAYNSLPTWVSGLFSGIEDGVDVEFDMTPITQRLIRRVLSKCSNSSSPGPDGISYYHLKSLPCTHLF